MIFNKSIFSLFLALFFSSSLLAQNNNEYQLATRLMQQQQYADALPILQELNQDYPETYIFADRLIDCHIQLKEYDKGLELAKKYKDKAEFDNQVQIKIGELYHFKGQKEKALDIWFSNLDRYPEQLQLYITTARIMVNRREYMEAVEVYQKARIVFQNDRLFFGDIANTYMRAGEYELAIEEWLTLLKSAPNQISFIQRSLLRYNDPVLYDVIIVELNDQLDNISVSNPSYETFYNLQIWLLQENKLFRRALAVAKEYESRTKSYNYSLFNLGKQLIENNEFELAEQAFKFYTDNTYGEIKWRGLEELSNTYSKQAKYLDDYNLDFGNQRDSLYKLATTMLDSIETETNNYSRMGNVLLKRAELALDFIFDLEKAKATLRSLKSRPEVNDSPEIPYLEGRIKLAEKEYGAARISLTRANKKANIGEMAEKTRYFLALTDFYSGDFEFASIQLKSLGRQYTSYYANDALELRLWLQQGLAEDSAGTNLEEFGEAVFKEHNGQAKESASLFLSMIENPAFIALKDDAMLFLVESLHIPDPIKFVHISNFLSGEIHTPIKEKLLWERAKIAERINRAATFENCQATEDCRTSGQPDSQNSDITVSPNEIYEELILQFPQGFYAPYARERLNNLTNENS